MDRRTVAAALVASLLISALLPLGASARSPRWRNLDVGATSFRPASLDATRMVTAIVRLAGTPVAIRTAEAASRGTKLSAAQKQAIRADLKRTQDALKGRLTALDAKILFQYQDAFNGLSVRLPAGKAGQLAALPGVKSVQLDRIVTLDNVHGVPYIGAPQAWQDYGYNGTGVRVAIIDSGVDYYHANLGGSGDPDDFDDADGTTLADGGFPTAKVVAGFDFAGDDYNASGTGAVTVPVPDPDPLDCNGHGSHVAGSAAGIGVTSAGNAYAGVYDGTTHSTSFRIGPGVAPRALLLAYRVFGCDGSSATSVIVAAINRAVIDNADVINMSIGSPFTPPDDAFSLASDAASAAGVTVIGSAGNEGPSGYITGGAGAATRALSVAALDATGPTIPGATIDGPQIPDQDPATGGDQPITGINANDGPLPVSGTLFVLHNADGSMSLGCEAADYAGAAGKIVVTLRGVCARVARAELGDAAGAIAVIMVNNGAGLPPFEGPINGVDIPFIGVAPAAGPVLDAADGTAVTINATTLPNAAFQRSADFTSGGPRNDDSAVKPEVSAPGVSLVSTGVGTGNGSATLSGTSMAAPHTAGAAALVVQAHPAWTPNQVKAALMNTADATTNKILGYNLRLAGNGVIAARRAVDTVALATTGDNLNSLTFGYQPSAAGISQTRSFTITNTSGSDITYELSGAFNGNASGATIAVSPTSVTVGANSSTIVDATVSMSAAAVTALPQASTYSMLAAGFAWGGVLTVRGAITAHPTVAATGRYDLRVPFMLVPRGLSNVTAGAKAPYTKAQGISRSSVLLSNTGGHSSDADVYAWGISDPNEGFETMDIRTVGAQTLPGAVLGGAAGDRSVIFAINTYGRFTNASVAEYDIVIDTNKNGKPDFFVVGVDFGAVTGGSFDGRFASFIFNAKGDLVNAWVADGPMNGSTVLLPTLASDIGLKQGKSNFRYSVSSFPIVEDAVGFDSTALAAFDSHKPGVSSGQFIPLAPGATATLNLAVDHGKFQSAPARGWLVVALDDANGAPQADQIPLGNP